MPQYVFTICRGQEHTRATRAAELSDDGAALAYASELARKLAKSDENPGTGWLLKVSDEARPMVFAIPFFAACA